MSVALLMLGIVLLLATGVSPLDGGPGMDLASLLPDVAELEPAGLLWLGLLAVIVTPISRVIAAALAYGRAGDWSMVAIALGILAIIAVGVATAVAGTV
jgi:uncharacterized membrane protein